MRRRIEKTITEVAGSAPVRIEPMGGGCVGDVSRVTLEDGRTVVAKTGDKESGLDIERFHAAIPAPEGRPAGAGRALR